MPLRRPRLVALALGAGATMAACGAGIGGTAAQATPPGGAASSGASPTTTAGAGGVTRQGTSSTGVRATLAARLDPATGLLTVTATVTGPAELFGGCQPTLALAVTDPAGVSVPSPSLVPPVRCLAIMDVGLAAGQTRTFTATARLPAARGRYTIHARLNGGGDLPPMSIAI